MKFNRNVIDMEIVVVKVSVLDRVAGVTGVTGDISDEVDADAVFPHGTLPQTKSRCDYEGIHTSMHSM